MAKFALLIGISEYEQGFTPLPTAVGDVDAVYELLVDPDIGGFDPSNIRVLKNRDRSLIEQEIEWLFVGRQKDDLVLLFFSGHGVKDDHGRLHFAVKDTRKTEQDVLSRPTAVSARNIHEFMNDSRSKRQVVILDCCFSGAFSNEMLVKGEVPKGEINLSMQLGGEGRVVLASSNSTEYSFATTESNLSVYTHFLVEGVRSGEADINQDGYISADDLNKYIRREIQRSSYDMNPQISAAKEGYDIQISQVSFSGRCRQYREEVKKRVERGEISVARRTILDIKRKDLELDEATATEILEEVKESIRQQFSESINEYERVFKALLESGNGVIDEPTRRDLRELQGFLNLDDVSVSKIEKDVTQFLAVQKESYQAKLNQYEQEYMNATKGKEYPNKTVQEHLRQKVESLGLAQEDIDAIEAKIRSGIEDYQRNRKSFLEEFERAVNREYPLARDALQLLQEKLESLGLTDEDVIHEKRRIEAPFEERKQRLDQYAETFRKAIQDEPILSTSTRADLLELRQVLGIADSDTERIEGEVHQQFSHLSNQNLVEPTTPLTSADAPDAEATSNAFIRQVLQNPLVYVAGFFAAILSVYLLPNILRSQMTVPTSTESISTPGPGSISTPKSSRLNAIRSRGKLICGVEGSIPGFSFVDSNGKYSGLDVDICRAVAVAIFDTHENIDAKIEYRNLDSTARFPALASGEVDMLSRNSTWTMSRSAVGGNNFSFGPTTFYDGQGMLVKAALGAKTLKDLAGKSICVETGTTTELNLADEMREAGVQYNEIKFQDSDGVYAALAEGRCDAATSDRSQLAARRTTLPNPDEYVLMDVVMSKEPLAPLTVNNDAAFSTIIDWVVYGLFQAEEFGITQGNVDQILGSTRDPAVKRFLGAEGDLGEQLGVSNDFMIKVIKAVGNYGEIFGRNVGSGSVLRLDRGQNNLWTKGGLIYSPPFR
jgi:general L-amino acid transport system substrate-binding protein